MKPEISVVIPVYNEQAGLQTLFDRLYPALDKLGNSYEIVFVNDGSRDNSVSILAEPPVAVVDAIVDKRGTRKVAEAYLEYLYSPVGQKLAAKHYYRPVKPELADPEHVARFPKVNFITIEDLGGWQAAQKTHFADGGVFDQVYAR